MPESTVVHTNRDGLVKFVRGAESYTVAIEPGDFQYAPGGYETVWVMDRDEHGTPRKGAAGRTTFQFSAYHRDATSTTFYTLPDICEEESRSTSYWATNTTSTLTNSDQKTSDVVYVLDGSAKGSPDATFTFDDSVVKGSFAEGKPSTYNVTGEAAIVGPAMS